MKETTLQTTPRLRVPQMATLLIKLESLECERRVLIPGDRFLGFLKNGFPSDRLMFISEGSKTLPTKMISLGLSDAIRFHRLLEADEALNLLETSDEGNLRAILASQDTTKNTLVRLRVYGLDPLFGSKPIQEDTYLKLTLKSPAAGVFTIEALPPRSLSPEARNVWFDAMDAAFDLAMEQEGYPRTNYITLSLAYRLGGPSVYREPGASFLEYLRSGRHIDLVEIARRQLVWKRGTKAEDIQLPELKENYGEESRAAPVRRKTSKKKSSFARLDEFLNDYEFNLEADEVEAFFIDATYRNLGFQKVWDRYFKTASQWEVYPEAADELMVILKDFVESELRGYDPQKDPYGELRTNILNIYAEHIAYIRDLDAMGPQRQDLPVQEFSELAQLISQLTQVLVSLNPPPKRGHEEKAEGVDDFLQILPQVELIVRDLHQRIRTQIKKRMGRRP